jgi:hypothetical protein
MQKNSIVLSYSSVLLYLKSKKKMLLSGVGYSAEKASMLWDTVHRIRFCCGVGYNRRKNSCLVEYNRKNHFHYISLQKKNSCVVGYNGKKYVSHPEIVVHCIPQRKKTSSVVSHNEGKLSLLYPTTQEMLLRCIPQQQKN